MPFVFSDWTFVLYTVGAILALGIGLYRWFRLTLSLRLILAYAVVLPFWQLFNSLMLSGQANDSLTLNLVRIIQIGLISGAYLLLLEEGALRKILLIVAASVMMFSFINLFFIQGAFSGNTYTQHLYAGLALLLTLSYIHTYTFQDQSYSTLFHPWFLISIAIMANILAGYVNLWFITHLDTQTFRESQSAVIRAYTLQQVAFFVVYALALWRQNKPKESRWSIN